MEGEKTGKTNGHCHSFAWLSKESGKEFFPYVSFHFNMRD